MVKRQPLSGASSDCSYLHRDPSLPPPSLALPPARGAFPGDLIKPLFILGYMVQATQVTSKLQATKATARS